MMWSYAEAQQVVGYTFQQPNLLRTALTHRSYLNEHPEETEDYERLEFLGDAVLDLVVAEYLFQALPDWPEGALTFLRASLVRAERLAEYARQIELGRVLRLGRGMELSGGRNHTAILADAFEAVVGAIYLDGGLDAARTWVLDRFIAPTVAATRRSGHARRDPKSRLQEAVQARYNITPRYAIVDESGPEHDRRFTAEVRIGNEVWGVGEGRSKQEATLAAAEAALRRLENEA